MAVRAVRGAVQIDHDNVDELHQATAELVTEVMERNGFSLDDMISVIFTVTPDLTCDFPAHAARRMGLTDVPLMCSTEIPVAGALPRVIRVMAHVETDKSRQEIQHVYLRGAAALRRDIAQ